MKNVKLSVAMVDNPRSHPLLSGEIQMPGITLRCVSNLQAPEIFRRQLRDREFDVSDMSMTTVFMMRDHHDKSFVALPIFTMREFFHTSILVRSDVGVSAPLELEGKRFGMPNIQSAAALWIRGALQHEFGIDLAKVSWFTQVAAQGLSDKEKSHSLDGGNVQIIQTEHDIATSLLSGEIDAAANLFDRGDAILSTGSGVRRLFTDPHAEGARYFAGTGLYPVNHCVVIRTEIAERYPWVISSLYSALLEARDRGAAALQGPPLFVEGSSMVSVVDSQRVVHSFEYGVDAQRPLLETFSQYCYEQGLTSRLIALEEIFHSAMFAT